MLAYAKGGMYQRVAVSVDRAITDAVGLVHKGKALGIEVSLDLSNDLLPVIADPGQMNQVFVNLFINAFEAMERDGGRLTVHASNAQKRGSWMCPLLHQEHPAGDYVYVRITDTGVGMTKETTKRIFEPFFSTKFVGRGLGLAAAAGIIQNHGGCISVESCLGEGTVFEIYLPAAGDTVREAGKDEGRDSAERAPGNKILVVDDEPQILRILEEMLTSMGYICLTADGGAEALEIFRKERGDISVAILDIQMPGMNGRELLRDLKTLKPDLKALISSGYDEATAREGIGEYGAVGFIQKPYHAEALKGKLQGLVAD
jgi:CheY-like chemotaxis protein